MNEGLTGKVVLVTGAGTGIGAEICKDCSKQGARVALVGRRIEKLNETAAHLSGEHLTLPCDVNSESDIQDCVDNIIKKFGQIDVLVNNAGIFKPTPFCEIPTQDWDDVLTTNLRGSFLFSRTCWNELCKSRGQIVNMSSIAGTQGFAGSSAYCASKFGLNGLSEVLAIEGKEHGIRVFAVCPGSVETPIWEARAEPETLARMMKPHAISSLVTWLLTSPRSIAIGPVVVTNFENPWD